MYAFGEPVQQVAEGELQLALEGEELSKDRTFVCTFFSPYYELCETGTTTPKWCANSPTSIFCPDDLGGSSGGGGAGRTWDAKMCLDENFQKIPCAEELVFTCAKYDLSVPWQTGINLGYDERTYQVKPCDDLGFSCFDKNLTAGSCNYIYSFPPGTATAPVLNDAYKTMVDNACYEKVVLRPMSRIASDCTIIFNVDINESNELGSGLTIDKNFLLLNPTTGLPYTGSNFEGGYPLYVEPPPTDPYDVDVPVGNEECGAICTWLSYIYNIMRVVNQSVLKVDASIQEMVQKMTPQDIPINSVLLEKLNEILVAIDKISFEIVKEAETNFWDVLGGAFGDIFGLIEFLIEKVIYLVIPEDTTAILSAMDSLKEELSGKVEPIHEIQTHITSALNVEQKEFVDIKINLPKYGEVKFFNVEYLLQAMPYIRMLLSASMILMTSIWAYKKVSSEMVR